MKKISLIVMSCIIACGLLANHGIVKGGEMSPKVEDTVSIAKKITDSQWLSIVFFDNCSLNFLWETYHK